MNWFKSWFSEYKADLPAGMVVFLVALPLCLGIGLASTGNPELIFTGIIAGVVGGMVVGILSGSQLGVSGPAAGLVVIIFNAIVTLGSYEAFLLSVILAGVIQFLAGWLRMGIIGYYFPSSVIKGMLAAIGIILILKELPHALGYEKEIMDASLNKKSKPGLFSDVINAIKNPDAGALIIAGISMVILVIAEFNVLKRIRFLRFIPVALLVVLSSILVNSLFHLYYPEWALTGNKLVQLPVAKNVYEFMGFFIAPDFSQIDNPEVYEIAFTLAIVASLETLLSVEATDKLDPQKRLTPTNRELKAQGIGNIVAGLIGGLPITQVIVRSSANISSGGKTKLSAVIHGFLLLSSAFFIPGIINLIPLASLACILLVVGYKLANIAIFKRMMKLGFDQFLPFVITIVFIVMSDLLKGIGVGMIAAVYFILRKNYQNSYSIKRYTENGKKVAKIFLSEEVTFLNKPSIADVLHNLPEGSKLIIDGSHSKNIEYDVIELIEEFSKYTSVNKNIECKFIGIPELMNDDQALSI
jgi:MFS superfamily sulfate permease-like transporter